MRFVSVPLTLFCLFLSSSLWAKPVVTFEPRSATLTGATPGADTAWFAFSSTPHGHTVRVSLNADILPADSSGSVTVEVPNEIPTSSVWVVCDLPSGGYTVAAPPEYKIKASSLGAAALRNRSAGNSARIEVDGEQELFYVRPGVGAWRLTGTGTLVLSTMERVGKSPAPPDDFRSGDLLFIADPLAMVIRSHVVR